MDKKANKKGWSRLYDITISDVRKSVDRHREEIKDEMENARRAEMEAWKQARNFWVC